MNIPFRKIYESQSTNTALAKQHLFGKLLPSRLDQYAKHLNGNHSDRTADIDLESKPQSKNPLNNLKILEDYGIIIPNELL